MGKIAFVFAGQGAQYEGMGKDLYDAYPQVKNVFETAREVHPGLVDLCFTSSLEELSKTVNAQPCMFVLEVAIAKLLEENNIYPKYSAGFSLGEAGALSHAGALDIKEGTRYILQRAQAMDQAAADNPGKMAAVLKIDREDVDDVCARHENVWAVNYNCPGQTVISGSDSAVEEAAEQCRQKGARTIFLKVSGAFHTPFMDSASKKVMEYLTGRELGKLKHPVYSNTTGERFKESEMKELMSDQISLPVEWIKVVQSMVQDGADTFIEIGPGKVLSGLIKKIEPGVDVMNVSDAKSFEDTIKKVKGGKPYVKG